MGGGSGGGNPDSFKWLPFHPPPTPLQLLLFLDYILLMQSGVVWTDKSAFLFAPRNVKMILARESHFGTRTDWLHFVCIAIGTLFICTIHFPEYNQHVLIFLIFLPIADLNYSLIEELSKASTEKVNNNKSPFIMRNNSTLFKFIMPRRYGCSFQGVLANAIWTANHYCHKLQTTTHNHCGFCHIFCAIPSGDFGFRFSSYGFVLLAFGVFGFHLHLFIFISPARLLLEVTPPRPPPRGPGAVGIYVDSFGHYRHVHFLCLCRWCGI